MSPTKDEVKADGNATADRLNMPIAANRQWFTETVEPILRKLKTDLGGEFVVTEAAGHYMVKHCIDDHAIRTIHISIGAGGYITFEGKELGHISLANGPAVAPLLSRILKGS